jgi:hypothetical protein
MEELLQKIQYINEKFSDAEWLKSQNGNVLSYTAMKLAAMKGYLIDVKANAQMDMLKAETNMETEKGKAYLKMKEEHGATAAIDAKNTVEEYIAAKNAYAEKRVNYERLKGVVADTHDLIEAIRSRVIDLQGARKDEGIR